jgi:hypothetical protein
VEVAAADLAEVAAVVAVAAEADVDNTLAAVRTVGTREETADVVDETMFTVSCS